MWERADLRLALGHWPWSLLAQQQPLPERILTALPDAIIDGALGGSGSPASAFPPQVRAAYVEALRDPAHAHAICEEYHAAATIDREHDRADRRTRRWTTWPLLVLWGAQGPFDSWYADAGGPIALWQVWASDMQGHAIEGGHSLPGQMPEQTADALRGFFGIANMGG